MAALLFNDEFKSFDPYNSSGHWKTALNWGPSTTINNEKGYYVDTMHDGMGGPAGGVNPFSDGNGVLTITAQPGGPLEYTSGVITTQDSFSSTYGYFEMRAQMPAVQGTWPAFWLMPTDNSWPPELDVVEMVGQRTTSLINTSHSGIDGGDTPTYHFNEVADMSQGFHTYGVDWQPDHITWYFDGQAMGTSATPADMHKPMYLIANMAVGGTFPGDPNGGTGQMNIDYVRVYDHVPGAGDAPSRSTDTSSSSAPVADATPAAPAEPAPSDTSSPAADTGSSTPAAASGDLTATGPGQTLTGSGDAVFHIGQYYDTHLVPQGSGTYTVDTWAGNYTLPEGLQNLTGSGGNSHELAGNSLDNVITASPGADTLTGGAGHDTFVIPALSSSGAVVTDFDAQADRIDVSSFTKAIGYSGSDPFGDGTLSLEQVGDGTQVVSHADGQAHTLVTLDHILPGALHVGDNLWA